ncbi:MAG TPA: hypothetical protein C5S50_11120 [Methanosarcinaceae archaeon]|nr:hypothetical protein [Methanosarcinaceae archaeon]
MRNVTILTLLFLVFTIAATGCIDELVAVDGNLPDPDISSYEFDVFVNQSTNSDVVVNTTTFYLSGDSVVNVIHMLVNTTTIDIVPTDMSSNQKPLTNIVIIADNANITNASTGVFNGYSLAGGVSDIGYTISKKVVRGQKHTYLEFNETITGFVAYTMQMPDRQDFIYIPSSPSIVRFVLPVNYTTGNLFVGIARPEPDESYLDNEGRENFIWYDLEDMPKSIMVKYYPESAPKTLLIIVIILVFGAAIVLANYYFVRKNLKKIRDDIEQGSMMDKRKKQK